MARLEGRLALLCAALLASALAWAGEEVVTIPSGAITLHGALYKPAGKGPFPAVVYNHGSAAGMLSKEAFDALGPVFAAHGWVFFGPYRRGQGLSASAGPYIVDQINTARKRGGLAAGAATMVHLLETDHLDDQLAALAWLRKQDFVRPGQIAVAGNSFGGIEVVLGAERGQYCADRLSRRRPDLGAGAGFAGAHDPSGQERRSADLFLPGEKRLRPRPEQNPLRGDE